MLLFDWSWRSWSNLLLWFDHSCLAMMMILQFSCLTSLIYVKCLLLDSQTSNNHGTARYSQLSSQSDRPEVTNNYGTVSSPYLSRVLRMCVLTNFFLQWNRTSKWQKSYIYTTIPLGHRQDLFTLMITWGSNNYFVKASLFWSDFGLILVWVWSQCSKTIRFHCFLKY